MFDFYLGLPHVCYYVQRGSISHCWVNVMEWEPSKSYQALTCEHVLTYELNHLWLPQKRIPTYHLSNTYPPPHQTRRETWYTWFMPSAYYPRILWDLIICCLLRLYHMPFLVMAQNGATKRDSVFLQLPMGHFDNSICHLSI